MQGKVFTSLCKVLILLKVEIGSLLLPDEPTQIHLFKTVILFFLIIFLNHTYTVTRSIFSESVRVFYYVQMRKKNKLDDPLLRKFTLICVVGYTSMKIERIRNDKFWGQKSTY